MLEETLGRIREIVLPRIEWFRIWFRMSRLQRQKEKLLARLGINASDASNNGYWPNTDRPNPEISEIIEKIRELEALEVKYREWLEYLEDHELSGVLAHLQEDLVRRTVKAQTILVTDDSPYAGVPINELGRMGTTEGTIPLLALRGNPPVEIGPGLPLMAGDRLVMLTVWKKLREVPPASTLFVLDGNPDSPILFRD